MPATQRIDWLDFAKGASIVLVVVLHATLILSTLDLAAWKYTVFNYAVAPARMATFFFVSGALGRSVLAKPWRELITHRLFPLAAVFVIWSVIHLAFAAVTQFSSVPTTADWVSLLYRPNTVLWFIWALAIYFALARLIPPAAPGLALALAGLVSLLAATDIVAFDLDAYAKTLIYAPFFLAGAYHRDRIIAFVLGRPAILLAASAVAFVGLYLVGDRLDAGALRGILFVLRAIAGVTLALTGAIFLVRVPLVSALVCYLGRNTLSIYVAHTLVIWLAAVLLAALVTPSTLWLLAGVPLMTAVGIAGSLALRKGVDAIRAGALYTPRPPHILVAALARASGSGRSASEGYSTRP